MEDQRITAKQWMDEYKAESLSNLWRYLEYTMGMYHWLDTHNLFESPEHRQQIFNTKDELSRNIMERAYNG